MINTAILSGTVNAGALGEIPLILVAGPKPRFRNNGWNVFSGQADLIVPGLADALPDEGRPIRQGHVELRYSCGGTFGTYTSTVRGGDRFSFC